MSYHKISLSPRYLRKRVKFAKSILQERGIEYEYVAGTGISGIVFASCLAYSANKKLIAVRKPDDKTNHSGTLIEYPPVKGIRAREYPAKILIVDDFPSSGNTIAYCIKTIKRYFPAMEVTGIFFHSLVYSISSSEKSVKHRLKNRLKKDSIIKIPPIFLFDKKTINQNSKNARRKSNA